MHYPCPHLRLDCPPEASLLALGSAPKPLHRTSICLAHVVRSRRSRPRWRWTPARPELCPPSLPGTAVQDPRTRHHCSPATLPELAILHRDEGGEGGRLHAKGRRLLASPLGQRQLRQGVPNPSNGAGWQCGQGLMNSAPRSRRKGIGGQINRHWQD